MSTYVPTAESINYLESVLENLTYNINVAETKRNEIQANLDAMMSRRLDVLSQFCSLRAKHLKQHQNAVDEASKSEHQVAAYTRILHQMIERLAFEKGAPDALKRLPYADLSLFGKEVILFETLKAIHWIDQLSQSSSIQEIFRSMKLLTESIHNNICHPMFRIFVRQGTARIQKVLRMETHDRNYYEEARRRKKQEEEEEDLAAAESEDRMNSSSSLLDNEQEQDDLGSEEDEVKWQSLIDEYE